MITFVFTASIGGLLAWAVMANRTNGPAMPLMSHPAQLRKLTATRDQMMKRSNRNL